MSDAPKVTFRSRGGARWHLPLLDVSVGGCMVARQGFTAQVGDQISIKLPELAYQTATVAWIEDDRAGIAFEQLLHEAVYQQLRQLIGGQAMDA